MNVKINITPNCQIEKKYIVNWFFSILKIDNIDIKVHNSDCYEIIIENKKFVFPDNFFATAKNQWLEKKSVPKKTYKVYLPELFAKKFNIEYLYSINNVDLHKFLLKEKNINIPIDFFGNAFFFITRYHEYVFQDKVDIHKRHLSKNLFLEHDFQEPIIDQYLFIFKEILNFFQKKELIKLSSEAQISCDVDTPYDTTENKLFLIRKKLLNKNFFSNFHKNTKSLLNYTLSKIKVYNFDALNTYEWIMKQNEKKNRKVIFFFISKNKHKFDSFYSLDEHRVQKILKMIDYRGHEIGLHGSYLSFDDHKILSEEKKILEISLEKLKIKQKITNNRFHLLRWSNTKSISALEGAGLDFDNSIYYADKPGFRSGTSKNFNLFNLSEARISNIIEKPLTMMDVSIFDENYLNISDTRHLNIYINNFFENLKSYNCNFNLLWHNSTLTQPKEKNTYIKILQNLND